VQVNENRPANGPGSRGLLEAIGEKALYNNERALSTAVVERESRPDCASLEGRTIHHFVTR